jgi:exosortase E/protease (VPEID-CTERM system)
LIIEIVLFSTRFDTATIEDVDLAWATALGQVSLIGRFAVSIVAALVIFSGSSVTKSWRQMAADVVDDDRRTWLAVSVHCLGAVAFYWLTAGLLEGGWVQSPAAPAWIAAWGAAAAVTIVAWALALYPFSFWLNVLARVRGILLLGALLGIGAVVAGKAADFFWPLLSGPTLDTVGGILSLFYGDVFIHHEELLIRVRDFTVEVGADCSGFEGVGLVGIFLAVFLWSRRDQLQFPQALAALPIGMAAIWVANIVRLVALISIGASISSPVAMGGFHSQAGWLAFNVVALGVVYVVWNSSIFRPTAARGDADGQKFEYAAGPYLAPFLMLVAVMMITTAMSAAGFDWLYPIRVAATLTVVAWYWPTYRSRGDLAWSWSWTPVLIGVAVFAMWMLLEPLASVSTSATAQQAQALATVTPAAAMLWILFRTIGSVVAVPLAEELAFRGFLTRKLISEDFESVPMGTFTVFSLLVSSLAFGLLHGRWIAGTAAGVLFALALYRRGRLMDAVVAHAVANALVTTYVLTTEDWAAWS